METSSVKELSRGRSRIGWSGAVGARGDGWRIIAIMGIIVVGDRKRVELTNGGESRNLEASKSGVYIVSECDMIT